MAAVLEKSKTEKSKTVKFDCLGQDPLVLRTKGLALSDADFFKFCAQNDFWRMERESNGDILIMTPAGGSSGAGNSYLTYLFQAWAKNDGSGRVFDSSTGFRLPNNATRAPDVAWVRKDRLAALTQQEWDRFIPLCPDFVLEFRSRSDRMATLHKKMEEYIRCGAKLGWLLDPINRQAFIYRPRKPLEKMDDPQEISGAPVLKGFVLNLPEVWAATEL